MLRGIMNIRTLTLIDFLHYNMTDIKAYVYHLGKIATSDIDYYNHFFITNNWIRFLNNWI